MALALVACPALVPEPVGKITPMTFTVGDAAQTVTDVDDLFTNTDDRSTFVADSDKKGVATASISGTTLTVTPVDEGKATVTITATLSNGKTATTSFMVTVKAAPEPDPDPPPDPDNNQPRLIADELPDVDDLKVGHPQIIELAPLFIDDEDDFVGFHAASRAPGTVMASATLTGTLTLTAVSVGTARIDVYAADGQHSDGQGNPVPVRESFNVTVVNQPPMAVTTGLSFNIGLRPGETDTRDLTPYFMDPEGHSMTYGASVEPSGVATASVDGTTLTIVAGANAGDATVTVTATDTHMGEGSTEFTLRVSDAPNQAPMAEGTIPDQTLEMDFDAMKTVDVMDYFSDPDGDMLTYTPASSMPDIVAASADGSMITITAVDDGMATITVTASDGRGGSVDQMFDVTVTNPAVPTWKKEIPDVTFEHDDTSRMFTLADYFNLATGYMATSDDEDVVTAAVNDEQTMLTLTRVGVGSAVVEITPSNSGGDGPTQSITVMVEAARQPPTTKADMMFKATLKITMVGDDGNAADDATTFTPDEIAAVKAATKRYMLSTYVTDPDGDDTELKFSTTTSANAVVAVYDTPTTGPADNVHLGNPSAAQLKQMMEDGADIMIRGRKVGTATITVTATDPHGLAKSWPIEVTVVAENSAPEIDANNTAFPGDAIADTNPYAAFAQLDDERRFKSTDTSKTIGPIDLATIFSDDDIDVTEAGNRRGDSWTFKVMSTKESVVTARLVSTNNPAKPDEHNVVVTRVGSGDASIYFVVTDSFGESFGGETADTTDEEGTLIANTFFPVRVNNAPVPYSGEGDDRNSLSTEDDYLNQVNAFAVTSNIVLVDDPSTTDTAEGYFSDGDNDALLCRLLGQNGDSATFTLNGDRNGFTLTGAGTTAAPKTGETTFTVRCFDQVNGADFESADDTLRVNVRYLQSISD